MLKTINQIIADENLYLNETLQWGTDKFTKHPYADLYDELLFPYRNRKINLLEIGVYHGASTILWNHYFVNGNITTVDIQPRKSLENVKNKIDESRTKIIINDAYNEDFCNTLPNFDIINDDGPHTLESQIKCIELYYKKLNSGGIMLIEDIPSETWFDSLIKSIPIDVKYQCYDFSKNAASDSRVFVLWK